MLESFVDQYMPARKISTYRKQITIMKMKDDENFNESWDRFQRLTSSCPQQGYTQRGLLEYFYEVLNHFEQRVLYTLFGGSLFDVT
ncbi:hypothetical protein Syun_028019 [Stephania yunnanensis]|uniref:Retrotransposon gag domain-containing protein n=1 Tax=Stephania yunnanensis TaxID=152371 RepID=A0AAP0EM59_9MAGN